MAFTERWLIRDRGYSKKADGRPAILTFLPIFVDSKTTVSVTHNIHTI